MKKVGIMTMQRIKNYGSFLQAFGLKKTIESLGYKVEFVDYNYGSQLIPHHKKRIFKKIKNNLHIIKYIKKKKIMKNFRTRFEKEFIPYLCGNNYNYNPKDIDTLVIGSDEVFNCLQSYPVGYSPELFGQNYESIDVISYAASFGQTNFDKLKDYGKEKEVGNYLKKMKSISVRDNNSSETVKKLTNIKPSINLDPVLISNLQENIIDKVDIKDYIIVYAYAGRLTKYEEKKIKAFAKKHHKKIVSFGMYQNIADIEMTVSPFELLAYFKHADFVITDTFHGSIFSIINNTNFVTIVRDNHFGNSNKLTDLLNRLSLKDRIINDISNLDEYYDNKIDFTDTNSIIEKEKNKTIEYLKNNL